MAKYKTKFYGAYKMEGNIDSYLVSYLNRFFKTVHIKRDVDKIKEKYNWKDWAFYGDLGYEGELYANPDDKEYGDKNLLVVSRYCHFLIEKRDAGYFLVWNGNKEFYHFEAWIKYLIDRFFYERGITLNGVMLTKGECERDTYYYVIYKNMLKSYYAKDPESEGIIRKAFSDNKDIIRILDEIINVT